MRRRLSARQASLSEIDTFRGRHRAAAGCQIVRDSILPRRLARPYLLEAGGQAIGYAGVWVEHFPGRVMEFYLLPEHRWEWEGAFSALVAASGATSIEAQTNLAQLHDVLRRVVTEPSVENVLFADGSDFPLEPPPGISLSRASRGEDVGSRALEGDWLVLKGNEIVGAGGYMTHYNPPYCDVYMEVVPGERRQGVGSYLVQELRRVAREEGFLPAARCDPGNEASKRTLLRGGFTECGRILSGPLIPEVTSHR